MGKRMMMLCLALLLLVAGCGAEKEKKKEKKDKKEAETFTFRDVNGNEFEAPLLAELEKASYDYSGLTEENGLKYYKDKNGKISSRIGIDVSRYQTGIDWQAVKKSGIEFAMIRLGYRGYGGEGKLVLDEQFKNHIEGALQAGLDVGVYFFSQAITEAEALEEARFVTDHLKGYKITCPVVFDTEEVKGEDARANGLDKEAYTSHCIAFCEAVKEAGYEPMIYANMKWFAFSLDLTRLQDYGIWYADYEDTPQIPYRFEMWQYTEKGQVPGISGNVDLNVWFGKE